MKQRLKPTTPVGFFVFSYFSPRFSPRYSFFCREGRAPTRVPRPFEPRQQHARVHPSEKGPARDSILIIHRKDPISRRRKRDRCLLWCIVYVSETYQPGPHKPCKNALVSSRTLRSRIRLPRYASRLGLS